MANVMNINEQEAWSYGNASPTWPEFVVNGETLCWINTDEWTLEMVADRDLTREEELYLIAWREAREAKAAKPLPVKPAETTPDTLAGGMRLRLVPEGVNPHQYAARCAKAMKLAEALHQHGITHDDALLFDDGMWRMAALGAGVNQPSVHTQLIAIADLCWLERAA